MEGRLLAAQTQTLDQVLVTRGVLTVQVIEQLAALINHSHTCTSGDPVSVESVWCSLTISAFRSALKQDISKTTYRYVEGGSDNATGLTNNFV